MVKQLPSLFSRTYGHGFNPPKKWFSPWISVSNTIVHMPIKFDRQSWYQQNSIRTCCLMMNLWPHEIKCTVSDDLTFLSSSFGNCCSEKRFIVFWHKIIHVIFSWAQIGRSAIFGREIGVQDREIFLRQKKKSSLMSKIVYLHQCRSL